MVIVPLDEDKLLEFAAYVKACVIMDTNYTSADLVEDLKKFLEENNLKNYQYTTSDLYPDA